MMSHLDSAREEIERILSQKVDKKNPIDQTLCNGNLVQKWSVFPVSALAAGDQDSPANRGPRYSMSGPCRRTCRSVQHRANLEGGHKESKECLNQFVTRCETYMYWISQRSHIRIAASTFPSNIFNWREKLRQARSSCITF
jgi:hypothetical protein